jgi:hypothetical protein
MKQKLIAYCDGGLGNRLNALIGAAYFASRLQLALEISWPINRWCAAPFEDLFDAPYPVDRRTMLELNSDHPAHVLLARERQEFDMPVMFNPHTVVWPGKLVARLGKELAGASGLIYFNNLVPPYVARHEVEALIRSIRVRPEHKDRASEFLSGAGLLGKRYWGLHLRGTDAGFPERYYRRWYLVSRLLPGPIVLCTDDKAVEARFLRNPAIVRRPTAALPRKAQEGLGWNDAQKDEYGREFNYNIFRGADAVRESMIDFEILGRSRVLQTSASTFLENARRYGGRTTLWSRLQDARAWLGHALRVTCRR